MAVLLTNKRQKLQNKEKKVTKNVIKTHASTALPQSKVDTDVVRSKAHTVDDASEWCEICEKKVPINMMQVHIAGRRHRKRERNCDAAARVGSKRDTSASTAGTAVAAAASTVSVSTPTISAGTKRTEKVAGKFSSGGDAVRVREATAPGDECSGSNSHHITPPIGGTDLSSMKNRVTHTPMSLARRRLTERVMEGFAVGNTAARPLLTCTAEARPVQGMLRLLFLGVGDVRNTLITLKSLRKCNNAESGALPMTETEENVHLHLNDICVPTLARAAVLLVLGAGVDQGDCDTDDESSYADAERRAVAHAAAVWSDAMLSHDTYHALQCALRLLLEHVKHDEMPRLRASAAPGATTEERMGTLGWLAAGDTTTWNALRQQWNMWLQLCDSANMSESHFRRLRASALRARGAGHARTGASASWKAHGVSSVSFPLQPGPDDLHLPRCPNATLLTRSIDGRLHFVECQGPTGAFAGLDRVKGGAGSARFAKRVQASWAPLFAALRSYLGHTEASGSTCRLAVRLWAGDALSLLARWPAARPKDRFDGIDSSNIVDYIGLWNLILRAMPCVRRPHGFLQTEQVLGVADSFTSMLGEEQPFDANLHRVLCEELGLRSEALPQELREGDGERVIRRRWFRSERGALPWPQAEDDEDEYAGEDPARVLQTRLYATMEQMLVPVPMTASMLSHPHQPILQSYGFPKCTTGTFVELIACICDARRGQRREDKSGKDKDAARRDAGFPNLIGRFFADQQLCHHAHLRNRTLALRIECSLRSSRMAPALEVSGAIRAGVLYSCDSLRLTEFIITPVTKRQEDATGDTSLTQLRGGVFEPALAVLLLKDDNVLAALNARTGRWAKDSGADEPINLTWEWLSKRSANKVQVLDNLEFEPRDDTLRILLPRTDAHVVTASCSVPSEEHANNRSSKKRRQVCKQLQCKHGPLAGFKWLVMIDVLQCEVLSKAALVSSGRVVKTRQCAE
eukprot:g494.t1